MQTPLQSGADPDDPDQGDTRIEFKYDYLGRRVEKRVLVYTSGNWVVQTGGWQRFVYDGWNVVLVLDGSSSNAITRKYAWGLDLSGSVHGAGGIGGLLAAVETGGALAGTYWYLYDGNGNVGAIVDATNPAQIHLDAAYRYDPYGNSFSATGAYAAANPFRFSTKWLDSDTALYYYGYRYYSPAFGRWISRDPIGEEGGLNLYVFVENQPICRIDPLGETKYEDIAKGRLVYSCNCGWIDWSHAGTSQARDLLNQIANGRAYWHSDWFIVSTHQGSGPLQVPGFTSVLDMFWVRDGLSREEQKEVALALYMTNSEAHEDLQARFPGRLVTDSGFSEEDLVSDLLGFYMAARGYSEPDIRRFCGVLTVSESQDVWNTSSPPGLGKNRTWTPVFHATPCCGAAVWPAELSIYSPAPEGPNWKHHRRYN